MKIAIVHPTLAVKGGAQNVVVWLAWGLRQRGHQVAVFTTACDPTLWPARYTDGLDVTVLGEPLRLLNSNWLRLHHYARALRRRLPGFDLVNCHNPPAQLWAARARRHAARFPTLVWYCEEPNRKVHWQKTNRHLVAHAAAQPDGPYNAHLRAEVERDRFNATRSPHRRRKRARDVAWDRAAAEAVDRALVNSRFSRESFQQVFGRDATVCHLGVPTDRPPPQVAREDYVAVVSPLTPKKNVHNVVEAMDVLAHRWGRSDVRLRIVGDGPARGALEALAAERGLAGRVEFLGYLPDGALPDFYARARLSVYVPIDEPFGLVPVESMRCGTPPVVSNHGGPLDSVVHGETGLHVDPFDPEAIAAAVRDLYDDDARIAAMGEAGARRVRDTFSLDRFLDRFERLALGIGPEPPSPATDGPAAPPRR